MIKTIGPIEFELSRRPVKNLRISVKAPDGRVQVVAPRGLSDSALKAAITSRIDWILKHQKSFSQRQYQSPRQMIEGEEHYLWGSTYNLNVVYRSGKHEIKMANDSLVLFVRPNTKAENKKSVLYDFYRQELIKHASPMFEYWQKALGVTFKQWTIRRMKTKWGSCSPHKGHILLNLELAKKPLRCLEYVILHELVHLIEPSHNKYFKSLLDLHMSDWRQRQDELNGKPL